MFNGPTIVERDRSDHRFTVIAVAFVVGALAISCAGAASASALSLDARPLGSEVLPNPTKVSVECAPSPVAVGSASHCTASVTDVGTENQSAPTGELGFSSDAEGSFLLANCVLAPIEGEAAASCAVEYTPSKAGTHGITAEYLGDAGHEAAKEAFSLKAEPQGPPDQSTTTLRCGGELGSGPFGEKCVVLVADVSGAESTPTGKVGFASDGPGAFEGAPCALQPLSGFKAACEVEYKASKRGSGLHKITATYPGDAGHEASESSEAIAFVSATSTTLSCAPGSVEVAKTTICTATVTDLDPEPVAVDAGEVEFAIEGGGGAISPTVCTLQALAPGVGACQVGFTPDASHVGAAVAIAAGYRGGAAHTPSVAEAKVAVAAPLPPPPVAPETAFAKLPRLPREKTTRRVARFRFSSDQAGASFECKLDDRPFAPCENPFRARVDPGAHAFRVRAVGATGLADPTPAVWRWRVLAPTRPPRGKGH